MSIEIDSEQGICSVEIEGSRHRAPVDSLRIGTDAEARLSVLYIDGKRLHISEEDAQRLVLVAAFALEVEDLQHPLHRTGLAALAEKAHAGAQEDIQRRHPGVFVGYLNLAEGAVAHRQADLDLVLVVAVDRTARNPGGVRQVGHGSSAHALFQENPLGGIEYAVAGFLGFLFGFPGH